MYLNEILNDAFFLVLIIALSIIFLFIGWRNYTDPGSKLPASPLGRYFLNLVIKKNHAEENDAQKAEITQKIVRIDAIFALIAGLSVFLIMIAVLALALLS